MSFCDHIRACNSYDPARTVPLTTRQHRIGLLLRDNAELLREFPQVFRVLPNEVSLVAEGDIAAVSHAIDTVVDALVAEDRVAKWGNETFDVAARWGEPTVFRLDRGAAPFFGTRAYGVHVNGYRRDNSSLHLWVGRRAVDKQVAPNKLDNLVAGGIGNGYGIFDTLVKECEEEASIPPSLSRSAVPAGAVSYRMENRLGIRDDVLFIYDIEMPTDFVPKSNDGEIAEFSLLPAATVIETVRNTNDFKFNVNLVILDFAVRHGLLSPEDPDYLEIVAGLHRPLD